MHLSAVKWVYMLSAGTIRSHLLSLYKKQHFSMGNRFVCESSCVTWGGRYLNQGCTTVDLSVIRNSVPSLQSLLIRELEKHRARILYFKWCNGYRAKLSRCISTALCVCVYGCGWWVCITVVAMDVGTITRANIRGNSSLLCPGPPNLSVSRHATDRRSEGCLCMCVCVCVRWDGWGNGPDNW